MPSTSLHASISIPRKIEACVRSDRIALRNTDSGNEWRALLSARHHDAIDAQAAHVCSLGSTLNASIHVRARKDRAKR